MIKQGAKIAGLQPEMVLAYVIVAPIMLKYGQPMVLTEGTGGEHSKTSRHYIGYAIDIRNRNIKDEDKDQAALDIQEALGTEYVVVLHKTHIHIQFNGSVN